MPGDDEDDKKNEIINIDDERSKRGRPPQRGRPVKTHAEKSDFMKPVTISFLSSVLRKDKRTIERKLASVAPVKREGKSDLYDFVDACEAVFSSKSTLSAEHLASLKPDELPPITQAAFWNAQAKRAEVYQIAGDLYRSDDIQDTMDAIIKVFRDSIMALPDKIKAAQKSGKTTQDVAYAILESVEDQASRSIKDLGGQSFSAELALIEEQMSTQDLFDAGGLPEDD